jgi:hypothetical protein
VILGRFRVEAELGRGAGGYSYRAVDLETDAPVVVKELPGELKDQFGRFRGEIAVLEELAGSFVDEEGMTRVLRPIAVGQENDHAFAVRPFVEGTSLRARLEKGPLPEDEIRTVLGDVARSLGAAHRENLVLRNLKPENILMDAAGRAWISGMGTGCFLTRARREELGVVLGGLRYVAPEQLLDARRVDRRTDLFSLGLVLHEALTGRAVVGVDSVQEAVQFLAKPFSVVAVSLKTPLEELALRLMHFHPQKRPPDAGPVLDALAPWRQSQVDCETCEACDGAVAPESSFCCHCGRSMRGPCPHCGEAVPAGAAFCRSCGARVEVAPVARLVGLVGSFSGENISLPRDGVVRLGRARECTVSFEARDQYVSRHQAELQVIRGRRWLRGGDWDTGRPTTNGTLVNGRNLDGAGLSLLQDGDRVRVGDSFFRYEEAAL